MSKRNLRVVVCVYALFWAGLLSGLPLVASAQSAIVNTHKPYTLKVRYGANADPTAAAADGPKARRIETRVAELDSGRIETRDAVLEYWLDATGDSGDIALSVDFTFAMKNGQMQGRTRLLMGPGKWTRVAFSEDSESGDKSIFVRVDRN